ncbi:Hypothetical predicted protein [Cloeon dipterum]|uniref:EF-hand domain-containing protein n=1 Tax=Cloeon dipterum TaxID=197152 RepID=A0A8S1C0B4_9INSE|nr:Hypothetical predicted protein [Cloeon dipterum]
MAHFLRYSESERNLSAETVNSSRLRRLLDLRLNLTLSYETCYLLIQFCNKGLEDTITLEGYACYLEKVVKIWFTVFRRIECEGRGFINKADMCQTILPFPGVPPEISNSTIRWFIGEENRVTLDKFIQLLVLLAQQGMPRFE